MSMNTRVDSTLGPEFEHAVATATPHRLVVRLSAEDDCPPGEMQLVVERVR